MRPNHRFTSKLQGQQSAKKLHLCLTCLHNQPKNWDEAPCPACGRLGTRQVFSSLVELKRGAELILAQGRGEIRELKFQPRFPLIVEGEKITTYIGDNSYIRNVDNRVVIEDVKPLKFMDSLAKFKIGLFNALHKKHGLTIKLIRKG